MIAALSEEIDALKLKPALRVCLVDDAFAVTIDAFCAPLLDELIKAGAEGVGDLNRRPQFYGQVQRLRTGYRIQCEIVRVGAYGRYEKRCFLRTPVSMIRRFTD